MTRRYYIFIFIFLLALFALAGHYLPNFQALSLKSKDNTTTSDFFIENMNSTVMLEKSLQYDVSEEDQARHRCDVVLPSMLSVRRCADELEEIVADDLWPLPTYQEMLFIK